MLEQYIKGLLLLLLVTGLLQGGVSCFCWFADWMTRRAYPCGLRRAERCLPSWSEACFLLCVVCCMLNPPLIFVAGWYDLKAFHAPAWFVALALVSTPIFMMVYAAAPRHP